MYRISPTGWLKRARELRDGPGVLFHCVGPRVECPAAWLFTHLGGLSWSLNWGNYKGRGIWNGTFYPKFKNGCQGLWWSHQPNIPDSSDKRVSGSWGDTFNQTLLTNSVDFGSNQRRCWTHSSFLVGWAFWKVLWAIHAQSKVNSYAFPMLLTELNSLMGLENMSLSRYRVCPYYSSRSLRNIQNNGSSVYQQ